MVRRSLGVALWVLVGLLACFLGALNALVGTQAGRALLARIASSAVQSALAGTIEVAEVRGSLLTGVVLMDVRLFDEDSTLVAWLPRAEIGYNPIDFAAGRVVLMEVRLDRPFINIVEHANGKTNFAELLRLDEKDTIPRPTPVGPAGPHRLVLLRNVHIVDGSLVLRLQDRSPTIDPSHEIDRPVNDGRYRVRRFERLHARLAALRISAPRERGVRIDIIRLATESSDPRLSLRDAGGSITIVGDTLQLDLERVGLPGSKFSARGQVSWPGGPLLFDLAMRADSATLTDIRFVDPRFAEGAILKGNVELRSHSSRLLEIKLEPLDVTYGGGRVTGRVTAFSARDSGLVALRRGDLNSRNLSLELLRPYLDTLPFAGWLTGRTVIDGPMRALRMATDWAFVDSLVRGPPLAVTRIRGEGTVDAAGGDLGFAPFEVEAATVDLRTVRRLVPAFIIAGELDAVGTLTGTLSNARFSGTMRHRADERPMSVVRGVLGLDFRTDTLGIFADVRTDSLSFTGMGTGIEGFPLRGSVAGSIQLEGTVAAVETHFDLAMVGGRGAVRGDGTLLLGAPAYGARDFTLRAADVNLQRWLLDGPPTRLSFTATGSVTDDSLSTPAGAMRVVLGPSFFAGSIIDSGAATVRLADDRIHVDSLRLQQPGLITTAAGTLGWARPASGSLTVDFDADSLSVLDSLVTWIAGPALAGRGMADEENGDEGLTGSARVRLTLDGALDSLAAGGDAQLTNLRWRGWHLTAGRGRGSYQPGLEPTFAVEATADSIARGELGFGAAQARARGTRDSLTWFGRSRVGDLGAFLAGGRYTRSNGEHHVGIDSLAVLLPGSVWFMERPVELALADSVLRVDTLAFSSAAGSGTGRVVVAGNLPRRGPIAATVSLDRFPLTGVYALFQRDTLGVAGTITTNVTLGGTRASPTYAGAFALTDAAFGQFRAPFVDGTITYRNRRLDGELHLWRTGQRILDVTAHLPVDLALVSVPRRQLPETLSVQARADSVDLSVLAAVTSLVRQVEGVFTADLGIGGTWDAPRLRGGLLIRDAGATIPALNVRYDGMNGRLALRGDTILVESLTARSGQGGIELAGNVRLENLTRPVLALRMSATDFHALDLRNYLTVTASGQLTLNGPVFGATLSGRGTVTSGVLHFADLVNKRVVNLDEPWVQQLIDTSLIRAERLGPEFESRFLDSLRIQGLQLTMGSDVWLRSTEANIQLTGTVLVNKSRDNYLLSGTLQAPRGTYRLVVGPLTREFVVSQGTVRYFGTPDLDAELDIEARHVVHPLPTATTRSTEDITIIAHIRGTLRVPRLTLEAELQPLSQAEIISYLLFGRPSVELAGGQGALVRGTAASLVAGELERTFVSDLGVPLDYFEIRPGGDPDNPFIGAQFAAGWQIGGKTFLVLNAGFCPRGPSRVTNTLGASLQFRLSPEWRTEASFEPLRSCLGPEADQQAVTVTRQIGLDMYWERRY